MRFTNDTVTTPVRSAGGWDVEATIQRRGVHAEGFGHMGGQQFRTPVSVVVRGYGEEHRLSIPRPANVLIPAAIPVAVYLVARAITWQRRKR